MAGHTSKSRASNKITKMNQRRQPNKGIIKTKSNNNNNSNSKKSLKVKNTRLVEKLDESLSDIMKETIVGKKTKCSVGKLKGLKDLKTLKNQDEIIVKEQKEHQLSMEKTLSEIDSIKL